MKTLNSIVNMPEFEEIHNGSENYKSIIRLNSKWNNKDKLISKVK